MNKDRQIVSELRNFFTESGCGLGIQRIMNVLGTINITERQMARVQVLVGPWKMPMQDRLNHLRNLNNNSQSQQEPLTDLSQAGSM